MAIPLDGKVTKQLLKTHSGEFDLESIHTISLKGLDISDLGCIGECTALERVDLSQNDITKLFSLAGLASINYLNLSANRITSLEGLQSLDNLQSINLAGNLIGSTDTLLCLSTLEKLTDLRLKDTVNDLTNPVCMNNSYKQDVLKTLPKLVILDGERVSGPGVDFYQLCDEIDKSLHILADCSETVDTLPEPGPWVDPASWEPSQKFEQESNLADAESQLQDLLAECKRVTDKAGAYLESQMINTGPQKDS